MRKLVFRAVALAVVLVPVLAVAQGTKTKALTATYLTKEKSTSSTRMDGARSEHQDRRHRPRELQRRHHPSHEDSQWRHASRCRGRARRTPAAGAAVLSTDAVRAAIAAPAGGSAGGITRLAGQGYYIVSGSGTMFTDGFIVNGRHNLSPDLNGPTCGGAGHEGREGGDIIIVGRRRSRMARHSRTWTI
jgi:hypothetical protein